MWFKKKFAKKQLEKSSSPKYLISMKLAVDENSNEIIEMSCEEGYEEMFASLLINLIHGNSVAILEQNVIKLPNGAKIQKLWADKLRNEYNKSVYNRPVIRPSMVFGNHSNEE